MFASPLLFTGDDYNSTCFRNGAVCHPFEEEMEEEDGHESRQEERQESCAVERPPLMCLQCGGFLSWSCQVEESSAWECSLCHHLNDPFLSPETEDALESFAELNFSDVKYVERKVEMGTGRPSKGIEEHVHLIAMDAMICGSEEVASFLRHCLEQLNENTRVAVLSFGKCVNILRLCGGGETDTALVVDTLPGTRNLSHTLNHFFRHGEYLTPAGKALVIVKDIARSLKCMSAGKLENKTVSTTSCSVLLEVAQGLGRVAGPGIKTLLVTSRTLPLGHLPPSMKNNVSFNSLLTSSRTDSENDGISTSDVSRTEGYAALGSRACMSGKCWIDILAVGLHAVQLDLLDALAKASGGSVVSGNSLYDEGVLMAATHFFRMPSNCFPVHMSQTGNQRLHNDGTIYLEVRTSKGVQVEKLFGPGVMDEELLEGRLVRSWGVCPGSKSCSVDRFHVENTLMLTSGESVDGTLSSEKLYNKLCYNNMHSDHVISFALNRADPHFAISFVLHPTPHLLHDNAAFVQIITRRYLAPTGSEDGGLMTRVQSFKLAGTTDKKKYCSSVDVDVWFQVATRAITGDLHSSCDGMGLPKMLSSEKKDPVSALLSNEEEVSITAEVDDVVRDVVSHFNDSDSDTAVKAHQMCRALYHLREGPLLNGPCVNSQESHMLRSIFLSYSPSDFFPLVQGSLQLLDAETIPHEAKSNSLALESWVISSASGASPDSVNLLPDKISVLDLGNFILIRAGSNVSDEDFEIVCPAIESVIRRRVASRHPFPCIYCIKATSPHNRIAYARLNPSHTDTQEIIRSTQPLLKNMAASDFDSHLATMPYTDQRSYMKYIMSIAPHFGRRLREVLSNQCEDEDYLIERGASYPTVGESMNRFDDQPSLFTNVGNPSSGPLPPPPVASRPVKHSQVVSYPPPPTPPPGPTEALPESGLSRHHADLASLYPPPSSSPSQQLQ